MPLWYNFMLRIFPPSPSYMCFYLNATASSQILLGDSLVLLSIVIFVLFLSEVLPFFLPQLKCCLTLNLPPGLIWLFTLNNGNKSKGKCFSHWAGTMFFWYENSFPLFLKQSFDFLGFPFMTFRRKGNCCWIRDAWDFCFILYFSNIWTLLQDGTN